MTDQDFGEVLRFAVQLLGFGCGVLVITAGVRMVFTSFLRRWL